jgi:uncharacterized membrane protein YjgN (DUF898 family)
MSSAAPFAAPFPHRHTLAFDGEPAAYARIWAVNVALMVLTLGLYFPWARARYLRFVAQHTQMAGTRWEFHGEAWRMARPTLTFGSFLLLYALASYLDPLAGFVAALAFALLWPPVWRSVTTFRFYQTSRRGLRLRLKVSNAQAYEHVGLPLVLLIFPLAWLGVVKSIVELQSTLTSAAVTALLCWGALYPAIQWQSRRLVHGLYESAEQSEGRSGGHTGLALGGLRFELALHVKTLFMRYIPLYIVALALLASAFLLTNSLNLKLFDQIGEGKIANVIYVSARKEFWLILTPFLLLAYVLFRSLALSIAMPTYLRRTLSQGSSMGLRFEVNLPWEQVVKRQAMNTALNLLTLGLYWPFARMHMQKLRIQSITVLSTQPLEALINAASANAPTPTELAADMATADMGW